MDNPVTPELSKELMSRFDALCAKFGTTAEYLWTTIVAENFRGAMFSCISWLAVSVVVMLAGHLMAKWLMALSAKAEPRSESAGVCFGIAVAIRILSVVVLLFTLTFAHDSGKEAMQPNKAALSDIGSFMHGDKKK